MKEIDKHIRKTLRDIMTYIGADTENANIAQLQTYIEWVIEKARAIDKGELVE